MRKEKTAKVEKGKGNFSKYFVNTFKSHLKKVGAASNEKSHRATKKLRCWPCNYYIKTLGGYKVWSCPVYPSDWSLGK